MAAKAIILCASAFLVQTIFGQCYNYANQCGCGGYGSGYGNAGSGYGNAGSLGVATNGGNLPITSASPIAANGLSVYSNDDIAGNLAVCGQLPFLSAVALDGTLPTAGSGSVNYACGNGNIGISAANGGYGGYGAGYGGLGAGYGGLGAGCGCGCGCNGMY